MMMNVYHFNRKGNTSPARRALCTGGGHFVTRIGLRLVLPMVANEISCRPSGGRREAVKRRVNAYAAVKLRTIA